MIGAVMKLRYGDYSFNFTISGKIMKRKRLAVGIILLFLGISILPMVGSVQIEKEHLSMTMGRSGSIEISGQMGENGWYISCVTIILNFKSWPDGVNHSYYKVDDGNWCEYIVPVCVCDDGHHTVWAYYIDRWGNPSPIYNVSFKIDMTPPIITLTKENTGIFQVKFMANISDVMSGVWRVDFYLDDELQFIDYDFPFEWTWIGNGNHTLDAIGFDVAGNSEESSMSTSYGLIAFYLSMTVQSILSWKRSRVIAQEPFNIPEIS